MLAAEAGRGFANETCQLATGGGGHTLLSGRQADVFERVAVE